eukprot:935726-Prymnesium_polylepis.1
MAGDGGDACDVLWGVGDSDSASDEDRLTRSRAHDRRALVHHLCRGRARPRLPPPYTREELDQLYTAGHTRYDDDDADLIDDDDLTDLDDGFAAALAALASNRRHLGGVRALLRCRLCVAPLVPLGR